MNSNCTYCILRLLCRLVETLRFLLMCCVDSSAVTPQNTYIHAYIRVRVRVCVSKCIITRCYKTHMCNTYINISMQRDESCHVVYNEVLTDN